MIINQGNRERGKLASEEEYEGGERDRQKDINFTLL